MTEDQLMAVDLAMLLIMRDMMDEVCADLLARPDAHPTQRKSNKKSIELMDRVIARKQGNV